MIIRNTYLCDGVLMSKESDDLADIRKKLVEIDRKLDQLLRNQSWSKRGKTLHKREVVPTTLASLPEHLKETALAIATMGRATAAQVAVETGRSRAAESDYLNQLASRGFLKKERKGREMHFLVFALHTMCPQCRARVPMTLDHCPYCGASVSLAPKPHR